MNAFRERPLMPMRTRSPILLLLGALALTSLASVMAQTGGAAAPPPAPSQAAPPAEPKKKEQAKEKKAEEPKIVRWVCTDHLCGGCDGKCSRSGHVAVSRKGHCACTPTPGGKLDEAIQKAFEPHIKGS